MEEAASRLATASLAQVDAKAERRSGERTSHADDEEDEEADMWTRRGKARSRRAERRSGERTSRDEEEGEDEGVRTGRGNARSRHARSGERKSRDDDEEDKEVDVPARRGKARSRRAERRSGERKSRDEEEQEELDLGGSGGKARMKRYQASVQAAETSGGARPGKLGFAGVEDDGAAQSKYRGMSSGARKAMMKKMASAAEPSSAAASTEVRPPRLGVAFIDAAVHLGEIQQRDVTEAAEMQPALRAAHADAKGAEEGGGAAAEAPVAASSALLAALEALAGGDCAGCVAIYQGLEYYDALAGGAKYRSWEGHEGVRWAAFGLGPRGVCRLVELGRDLSDPHEPLLLELSECWGLESCVAIGPFGLEYTDSHDGRVQIEVLRRLLTLAAHTRKPLLLSGVTGEGAAADLSQLVHELLPEDTPVVCYDAGETWAALRALQRKTRSAHAALSPYLVLDGAVTFSKAAALHELAFDVPTDRLLLGSGAPRNLPTQAKGGRRSMCHPGHVTFVAERVAEIKAGSSGLDAAELATSAASLLTASCENAARAFGLAHHGVRRGPA